MCLVDGCEGGPPIDGGEPSGVAVGEDIEWLAGLLPGRQFFEDGEAVGADRFVDGHVFIGQAVGFNECGAGAIYRIESGHG